MGNRLPPIVGNWYAHRDKGALFQVVALDEDAGTIEIQEFDGGLDELDLDEWRTLLVDSAAQPEDWGGRSTTSSPTNSVTRTWMVKRSRRLRPKTPLRPGADRRRRRLRRAHSLTGDRLGKQRITGCPAPGCGRARRVDGSPGLHRARRECAAVGRRRPALRGLRGRHRGAQHGHRHRRVLEAVRAQLDKVTHTCFQITPYEPTSRSAKS